MDRKSIAQKRIISVLRNHVIATSRTLEQKISDAGPYNQRVDPHILTTVRNNLLSEGKINKKSNLPFFYLKNTPKNILNNRFKKQYKIYNALQSRDIGQRIGQCLEISIFRALKKQDELFFLGNFSDLNKHDDSKLYHKEEPPRSISGRSLAGKKSLDFIIQHPDYGWAGIEAKNTREWLYPDRSEIKDLLYKSVTLDIVPIMIARRIPFVTFKILSHCGVVFHQTYNQLFPQSEQKLAEKAKDKKLLGYHDIRIGNYPDKRLIKFICENLPKILSNSREKFIKYNDLLTDFAIGSIEYKEFSARVQRRSEGKNENSDWDFSEDF